MLSQKERIAVALGLERYARERSYGNYASIIVDVISAAIAWSNVDPEIFRPEILDGMFGRFDCDTFAE